MTSETWREVPVQLVRLDKLVATQMGVYFDALLDPRDPIGGDDLPHVVDWGGELYLEDGHHRAVRIMLQGGNLMKARVFRP